MTRSAEEVVRELITWLIGQGETVHVGTVLAKIESLANE